MCKQTRTKDHTICDIELGNNPQRIKSILRLALDSIFNVKEEKRAYAIIGTIYDIAARRVIPIE